MEVVEGEEVEEVEEVAVVDVEEVAVSGVLVGDVAGAKTDKHWYLFRLVFSLT